MNNWPNMLGSICKIVKNGDYAKKWCDFMMPLEPILLQTRNI